MCRERFPRPKQLDSYPGMHHGTYLTALWQETMGFLSDSGHARPMMHAGIANPLWRAKRARHSRRMRNSQFYGSDKRHMIYDWTFQLPMQWIWPTIRHPGKAAQRENTMLTAVMMATTAHILVAVAAQEPGPGITYGGVSIWNRLMLLRGLSCLHPHTVIALYLIHGILTNCSSILKKVLLLGILI